VKPALITNSAEGAKYNSQGQARSASPLVKGFPRRAQGLKGRNSITPFQGWRAVFLIRYQGRRASRLPLAIIFRAFGAKA